VLKEITQFLQTKLFLAKKSKQNYRTASNSKKKLLVRIKIFEEIG